MSILVMLKNSANHSMSYDNNGVTKVSYQDFAKVGKCKYLGFS